MAQPLLWQSPQVRNMQDFEGLFNSNKYETGAPQTGHIVGK